MPAQSLDQRVFVLSFGLEATALATARSDDLSEASAAVAIGAKGRPQARPAAGYAGVGG